MSIVGSEQWMYNAGGDFYPYTIDQSLRFDAGGSSYLEKTFGATGNAKTFTISFWWKRSRTDTAEYLFAGGNDVNDRFHMDINASGTFQIEAKNGGSQALKMEGGPVLRDVSAWYHFVLRVDTTQATASDRVRLYKNGELLTFNSNSYPSQNTNLNWNVNDQVRIGRSGWATDYFSGYMAEFINVDGQSLGPDSFGEFKSGIWIPSDYSGSYGTNGFKLAFQDSAALGDDTSGNGHDFTSSGLAAHDQMPDSPTNNFPTFPKLALKGAGHTQHLQGNLQLYQPSWGGWDVRIASSNMPASGKYYWEVYPAQGNFPFGQGGFTLQFANIRGNENMSGFPQFGAPLAYFYGGGMGEYRVNPGWVNYTRSGSFAYTVNSTVFQVAVDCDNNKLWYGINNSWMGVSGTTVTAGTGNPATGSNGQAIAGDVTDYVFAAQCADQTTSCRLGINFGQDSTFAGYKTAGGNADENGYGDFAYAPPSGFVTLCSQNMPTGAINTLADETPEDYFNTVLYTGTGANNSITGVGFQTDFLWLKQRNAVDNHVLFDVVRGGPSNELYANLTNAEAASTGALISYDSDGFTLGASGDLGRYNENGSTYAAWNWKAGGTGVSNTDGSITSTVSAGATSQQNWFSISQYTGTGSSMTFGHGLGVKPDLFIVKKTNSSDEWIVYPLGATGNLTQYLKLHSTTGYTSDSVLQTANSSVLGFGSSGARNGSGDDYICYAFANAEGMCKVGSYVGNGSSDGSFINIGFRAAFVLTKKSSASGEWVMWDNKRSGYNVDNDFLYANASNSEYNGASYPRLDLVSNGFKMRDNSADTNGSGATYIYLAIAEQPFKYANAR